MLRSIKLSSTAAFLVITALFAVSCTTVKKTDTARTATEQLLLSTAADHALQTANLELFANHKVFLDTTYFDSYDSKYVIGTIRDALSRAGALLEENAASSDIIVEARSGALAIDTSDSLFGIPAFATPVPLAGSLQIPEIAFYKAQKQDSVAKIALLAFAKGSREHIYSSGSLDGKSYDKMHRFLFIAWIRNDLAEKQSDTKKMHERQTWYPQYDPANVPIASVTSTNTTDSNLSGASQTVTNAPVETPTNSTKP